MEVLKGEGESGENNYTGEVMKVWNLWFWESMTMKGDHIEHDQVAHVLMNI